MLCFKFCYFILFFWRFFLFFWGWRVWIVMRLFMVFVLVGFWDICFLVLVFLVLSFFGVFLVGVFVVEGFLFVDLLVIGFLLGVFLGEEKELEDEFLLFGIRLNIEFFNFVGYFFSFLIVLSVGGLFKLKFWFLRIFGRLFFFDFLVWGFCCWIFLWIFLVDCGVCLMVWFVFWFLLLDIFWDFFRDLCWGFFWVFWFFCVFCVFLVFFWSFFWIFLFCWFCFCVCLFWDWDILLFVDFWVVRYILCLVCVWVGM